MTAPAARPQSRRAARWNAALEWIALVICTLAVVLSGGIGFLWYVVANIVNNYLG